jgi:hypothetical protein
LARLAALGIEVRTANAPPADLAEKLAVGGGAAWIGSANATYAGGGAGLQTDWGIAARDPAFVDGLRAIFEANWRLTVDPPEVLPAILPTFLPR